MGWVRPGFNSQYPELKNRNGRKIAPSPVLFPDASFKSFLPLGRKSVLPQRSCRERRKFGIIVSSKTRSTSAQSTPIHMLLIVYTKLGCPWCREVIAFMKEKNVPFEEREVRGNKEWFGEMVKKSGQEKTPTLDLDGAILADTDVAAVELWLKEKKVIGN